MLYKIKIVSSNCFLYGMCDENISHIISIVEEFFIYNPYLYHIVLYDRT